jgi:hypothetical protein
LDIILDFFVVVLDDDDALLLIDDNGWDLVSLDTLTGFVWPVMSLFCTSIISIMSVMFAK